MEDDNTAELTYSGSWTPSVGNFSGGSSRYSTNNGDSVSFTYTAPQNHTLYFGTRKYFSGGQVSVSVDHGTAFTVSLLISGEDVLMRVPLGNLTGGAQHTVLVTNSGTMGTVYFDFFEIAVPSANLPVIAPDSKLTLATDWDTEHSLALPAERTAWLINTLGFTGRANHYVGALWFYELVAQGYAYASGTVTFSGTPIFSEISQILIGLSGSITTATAFESDRRYGGERCQGFRVGHQQRFHGHSRAGGRSGSHHLLASIGIRRQLHHSVGQYRHPRFTGDLR